MSVRVLGESVKSRNEDLLEEILGRIAEAVFVVDKNGDILYANRAAHEGRGYSKTEFLKLNVKNINLPERADFVKERISEVQKKGQATFETTHVRKDGSTVPVEVSSKLIDFAGATGMIAVARDITERKATEEIIVGQNMLFNALLESNINPVFSVDFECRYTSFNTAHVAIMKYVYGVDIELGKSLLDYLTVAEDREKAEVIYKQVLHGETVSEDTFYGDEKRSRRYFNVLYAPIKDSGGKIVGGSVFGRDITDQKRIEQELQEKKAMENFKFLADSANDAILVILGDERKYVYANQRAAELSGYTIEELCEIGLDELVCQDKKELIQERFNRRLAGKPAPETYEVAITKKNGERVLVEVTASTSNWYGQPAGVILLRDITDRKRAETALREKKARENFESLAENANDGVLVVLGEGRFVYANRRVAQISGYTRQQLASMSMKDILHPDEFERVLKIYRKRVAGRFAPKTYETVFIKKNGDSFPVEVTGARTVWQGEQAGLVMIRDITRRKQAEEAVQRERDAAQSYLDIAHVMIVAVDNKGKVILINRFGAELLGYREEEIVGRNWFDNFIPYHDRKLVKRVFSQIIKGGPEGDESFENAVLCKKGDERLISWRNTYINDDNGEFLFSLSSGEDVTDVNQARYEIRESHSHLQEVVDGIIKALANTVEIRDPYTAGHQKRVSQLAVAIARLMGWDEAKILGLEMASTIHDIGKNYVPTEILNKPGRLKPVEFELIKMHSAAGFDIIKDIDFDEPVAAMVRQHHERLNGSGYPDGLSSKDILPGAKIMAVADVVEAMSSDRPYRPGRGLKAALREVQDEKDELYDAEAVEACVELFAKDQFTFD